MELRFTKMQGLGNDFVVIDAISQQVELSVAQIQFIADRRFGIGCDQLLLVERPQNAEHDFLYRILNADGSEVEQCGNGARCFARFVYDHGLTAKTEMTVETLGGIIKPRLLADGSVVVDMGEPRLLPSQIPLQATEQAPSYYAQLACGSVEFAAISMGNPHAVLQVSVLDSTEVETIGPQLEAHAVFPNRVNVGFSQIVDANNLKLRVWERGAGETLACGTGACAAAVAGILWHGMAAQVNVELPGGIAQIQWQGLGHSVYLIGPAETVFEGVMTL